MRYFVPDDLEEREKCVRTAEKPSHRHVTASKNNVQISRVRTAPGPPSSRRKTEIITNAPQTDAHGDCQILLEEKMFRFPG